MKLTVEGLYQMIGDFIKMKPDVHKDMLITSVQSFSTVGNTNNMNPEERLRFLQFIVVSPDDNYLATIDCRAHQDLGFVRREKQEVS